MTMGWVIALFGAALAVTLSSFGSIKGVSITSQAAVGVLSEDPSKFGKMLVLQLLPSTQGIYGLIVSIVVLTQIGILGGDAAVSMESGLAYLMACLPIGFGGLVSALYQGNVATAGVHLIAKRPSESGKAITSASLVELYAIFSFVISLLIVINV